MNQESTYFIDESLTRFGVSNPQNDILNETRYNKLIKRAK
jgi:hypothetical protein